MAALYLKEKIITARIPIPTIAVPNKNDGAIRLTISKYYLPSGKSISEIGVSPDIKISEEGDKFVINSETDNQLNYAIKLITG